MDDVTRFGTAHLQVMRLIMIEILRQRPLDMAPVWAGIAAIEHPEIRKTCETTLASILESAAVNRPQ